jgi:hypothetical protein
MKLRNLKIQDDNGIQELAPGDTYNLSLSFNADLPKLSCSLRMTGKYIWDGKVLKQIPDHMFLDGRTVNG